MTENIIYYYPKNLRAKTQTLFWDFSSFFLILALVVSSFFLFEITAGNSLIVPFVFAVLTIKIDNITILEKIIQMISFLVLPVKFMNSLKQNSSQKLIGAKRINNQGVYTTDNGKFVMWEVQPHNLSVLSHSEITVLISKYTELLSQCPNLETMALDAASSIEHNIIYLQSRIKQENNLHIRKLLEQDLKTISSLSSTSNTTRRYLFVYKLPRVGLTTKDDAYIRQYEKTMVDLGFNVKQLGKEDIKSVLSNMFDLMLPVADYDGMQYIAKEEANV